MIDPVAIHESGHVAAAFLLNVPIWGHVSIVGDPFCDGVAQVGHVVRPGALEQAWWRAFEGLPVRAHVRAKVEAEVIVSMAGPMAEVAAAELWDLSARPVVPPEPARWSKAARERYLAGVAAGIPEPLADWEFEREVLGRVSGGEEEATAYRSWLAKRAWRLVSINAAFRQIVHVLAPELVERRELTNDQCLNVIENAFSPSSSKEND
jgi:hypothetical protein